MSDNFFYWIFQLSPLHYRQRERRGCERICFRTFSRHCGKNIIWNMKEAGVRGVIVNSRIINVFRKTFRLLNADIKRERKKCGGSGDKRLLGKWRDQTYKVKIFYHEIDNYLIEKKNQDLRGQKRTLEESLEEETTKSSGRLRPGSSRLWLVCTVSKNYG